MPGMTPAERSLRASIAAHTRWSQTPIADRRRQANRGHAALIATFAVQVDPDGLLPEEERQRLAHNAYSAHMKRLALRSSQARRSAATSSSAA